MDLLKYAPLIAGFALLAIGAFLGIHNWMMASNCERVDAKVIETEMTGMGQHGKRVVAPTFQYQDSSGSTEVWKPGHSATWYDFRIGQSVTLLIERDGQWRSVDDLRSLYLVPLCLTVFGGIGCVFGAVFLRVRAIQLRTTLSDHP